MGGQLCRDRVPRGAVRPPPFLRYERLLFLGAAPAGEVPLELRLRERACAVAVAATAFPITVALAFGLSSPVVVIPPAWGTGWYPAPATAGLDAL